MVDIIPQTYWESNLSEKLWIQFLTPMILVYSIWYILLYNYVLGYILIYWIIVYVCVVGRIRNIEE